MNWLEEFLKDVGKTGSELFSGTRLGRNIEATKQTNLMNQMRQVMAIQDPGKQAEAWTQLQKENPRLLQIEDLEAKAFRSGQEQRAHKSYKSLSDEEKKRWSNYGGIRSAGTVKTKGDRMVDAIEKQSKIQRARDVLTDEKGNLSPDQEERFRQAFETVNKEGGFAPTSQQPKPETSPEPQTEMERRARDFDRARVFSSNADVRPQQVDFKAPDIRSFFVDGVDPFARAPMEGEAAQVNMKRAPVTLDELGIVNRDAKQRFDELQKAMPDIDLRDEYQRDPQTFQKLFEAIKTQKLTTKEVIELLQEAYAK